MLTRIKRGHETNSRRPLNLYHVPAKFIIVAVMLAFFVVTTTAAWAVPEPRKIDTKNVTKFEEPAEAGAEGGHEGKIEEGKPDSLSEKKAIEEGEFEEEGHEGEEEHVPVWMFPGWQTVFALLGVGYYAFMLTYLPKIMAKEEGHH